MSNTQGQMDSMEFLSLLVDAIEKRQSLSKAVEETGESAIPCLLSEWEICADAAYDLRQAMIEMARSFRGFVECQP